MKQTRKAVALISGGLDSMLAAKLILEQGVHVEGLNFFTGFCVEGHTHALRHKDKQKNKRNNALWVAEQLGIRLHMIDVVEDYKQVLLNPRYHYGKYLNPCLDCKIFMVGRARGWMEENQFDFIITGEVVGQRPKSQKRQYMEMVSKQSAANDRLLRPLSAQHFPATLPEREGWVDREKLLAINGRSRKPQIALAEQFDIKEYAQPAGGCCFLTNEAYARKLADMWQHRGHKDYELDDILLLKVGRHLRPRPHFKMIVGREEGENHYLQGYCHQFISLKPLNCEGALTLVDGAPNIDDIQLAARIAARFSAGRDSEKVTIEVGYLDGTFAVLNVQPLSQQEIPQDWYIA